MDKSTVCKGLNQMVGQNFCLQRRATLLWGSSTAASCNGPAVELMMAVLDGFLKQLFDIWLCVCFFPHTVCRNSSNML